LKAAVCRGPLAIKRENAAEPKAKTAEYFQSLKLEA